MRILVITKRQYTARDLLDDRFGRFREMPLALARRGHQVTGICLSYEYREEGEIIDVEESGTARVTWHSLNAGALKFPGLLEFRKRVQRTVANERPDFIWACSDSFYGIIGEHVARRSDTRCVFDLSDNFESFGATKIPVVLPLYRRAVRQADGVTCVSRALKDLVTHHYRRTKPTLVLANAVQNGIFYPRIKYECRQMLGLPVEARIIGTAGALDRSRGIHALFEGFTRLAAEDPNIHLAIAGPRRSRADIPSDSRIHDFGVLPAEGVATLLGALDVAVVCNRDSAFGRYCFPQKAYEILACRVPVVAASVGAMADLLDENRELLFEPGNSGDLARAVKVQLKRPFVCDADVPTWDDMGRRLEAFLETLDQAEERQTRG